MWFWRRRRQQPPVLIPPLDRLAELVDSVVSLLDEAPPPPSEQPVAEPQEAAEAPAGHVLLLPTAAGYRLLARDGPPRARGDLVDLEEGRYRVVRLGPSPLPGDHRRCAFLEQEGPGANRTSTSA
ncbi:MAG: hypothetical protein QOJ43_2315 [Gaiellaceae bacterium]|jgi:hypothetical protein|nr:hypothetical protein [Gaiellaceae bacterium]